MEHLFTKEKLCVRFLMKFHRDIVSRKLMSDLAKVEKVMSHTVNNASNMMDFSLGFDMKNTVFEVIYNVLIDFLGNPTRSFRWCRFSMKFSKKKNYTNYKAFFVIY